jgi:hypothetical protein
MCAPCQPISLISSHTQFEVDQYKRQKRAERENNAAKVVDSAAQLCLWMILAASVVWLWPTRK